MKLLGLLAQDALKDYTGDSAVFSGLEKEKQKQITQRLSPAVRFLVESNADRIVKGDF